MGSGEASQKELNWENLAERIETWGDWATLGSTTINQGEESESTVGTGFPRLWVYNDLALQLASASF